MKGFTKDGKFRPTDKTISGVKKTILEKNPETVKIDNKDLMKEKATPEISMARVSSLSDGDLKKSVTQLNGIFSGQTNYLQKNNSEFDERVTKENHEKTLDTLNMLIKEQEQRALLKETKKKRKDETIDDDDELRAEGFAEQFDTKEEYEEALRERSQEKERTHADYDEQDDFNNDNPYTQGWLCEHGWTKEGVDCPKCNPEY